MRTLLATGALVLISMAAGATAASAGCKFGYQNIGGSIPAGYQDSTRFFTSDGGRTVISIESENLPLRVRCPGGGWRSGHSISCSYFADFNERVRPLIVNPNSRQVTYRFICHG